MDNNSNTQTQLNALRTLQQSYDALATASSNGATSVEVENAKQAILDAIGAINIDTSDLAKQGSDSAVTLTEVSEKIGVPASGQPSDLFAAIASGGGAEFYQFPARQMSATTASLDPNIMYIWGEQSSLTITLNTPTDTSIVNEYMLCFYSGTTPTTLTFTNVNVQVVGNIAAESIINVSIVYNSLANSYSVLIA